MLNKEIGPLILVGQFLLRSVSLLNTPINCAEGGLRDFSVLSLFFIIRNITVKIGRAHV